MAYVHVAPTATMREIGRANWQPVNRKGNPPSGWYWIVWKRNENESTFVRPQIRWPRMLYCTGAGGVLCSFFLYLSNMPCGIKWHCTSASVGLWKKREQPGGSIGTTRVMTGTHAIPTSRWFASGTFSSTDAVCMPSKYLLFFKWKFTLFYMNFFWKFYNFIKNILHYYIQCLSRLWVPFVDLSLIANTNLSIMRYQYCKILINLNENKCHSVLQLSLIFLFTLFLH